MKIEDLKEGQKILVECEFDSYAGANQAWVLLQGEPGLAQLDDIKLNQPKPVVPKFAIDWLEYCKNNEISLYDSMTDGDDELDKWFAVDELNRQELFAEAWLAYPNITVEKEKLYTVKILGCTLFKITSDNHVRYKLIGENETPSESKFSSYKFEVDLTEQEIKQADERLWQFAKKVTE